MSKHTRVVLSHGFNVSQAASRDIRRTRAISPLLAISESQFARYYVRYPILYEMRFNAAKVRPCKKYEIIFLAPPKFLLLEKRLCVYACTCTCGSVYDTVTTCSQFSVILASITRPNRDQAYMSIFASTCTYNLFFFSSICIDALLYTRPVTDTSIASGQRRVAMRRERIQIKKCSFSDFCIYFQFSSLKFVYSHSSNVLFVNL